MANQRLNNTGFGTDVQNNAKRFINANGKANVTIKGIPWLKKISWYHTLIDLPRWKFFALIFLFFIFINIFFAFIYFIIGIEHLSGIHSPNKWDQFGEAFFFSAQTFTTVGYGRISPLGFFTSSLAALEAMLGLLAFALMTGLLYGRFARAKAHVLFSDKAVIGPFKNGLAFMCRVAPYKNINLLEAEAKLTLGLEIIANGISKNNFFLMPLEYDKINALTLSWTIVHPITPESPLFGFTEEDFENKKGEFIVILKAFDDKFSTHVIARKSYLFHELELGGKFKPMYKPSKNHDTIVLDFDKMNDTHLSAIKDKVSIDIKP